MTRGNKTIVAISAITVAAPLVVIILAVFNRKAKEQEMMNDMKSVLSQSRVVDMNTLSSYSIVDAGRLIFPTNNIDVRFNFNSCCSEQQFTNSSRKFYKSGTTTEYGQTYKEWSGILGNYLPSHLEQGSFGDAKVKVQGKTYDLMVVNDTKAKKTTILISPK